MTSTVNMQEVLHWDFGILNDVKLERLRKSGTLMNNKKKANPSIKLANTARGKQDTFRKLNDMFGRNVKRLEAYYDYLMPKQIINLNIYLQKTSDLESLTLNFRGGKEFTDSKLISLGHALKTLHSLKVLDIEIIEPTKINDKGFHKFAFDLANLTHLKSFTLSVDLCYASDIAVGRLAKSIGHMRELRNLDLGLIRFANMQDKALPVFAYNIEKLKELESFILDLSWCRTVSEEGIIAINDTLAKTKTLKEYSLRCRKCPITDNTVTSFKRATRNLPGLEKVSLDMYGCPDINEGSLCELFKNFANMKNIKQISLYLGIAGNIPSSFEDMGMEMLGQAIKDLENLNEFIATFCEFKNLSDEGIAKLGKAMSVIKNLQKVELKFSACQGLTKEGIDGLGQLISENKKVNHVYLMQ